MILKSSEMKDMFVAVVKRAKALYRFGIKNYCVMGNHVHLIIQPHGDASLSKIMQWILSVFACAFNKRYNLTGHVWYDRFKSFILATLRMFLEKFVYIAENPVMAGIVYRYDDFFYCGASQLKRGMRGISDPPDIITCMFLSDMVFPLLIENK